MKGVRDLKKHGQFIPVNSAKYVGKYPIVMRSSWEKIFAQWLDRNPKIIAWSSESIAIKYFNPVKNRVARYYPDFFIKTVVGDEYIVEIKPHKETKPPINKGRKSKKTLLYENKTWAVNHAKFTAAKKWCKERNMKFVIYTEKELFGNK